MKSDSSTMPAAKFHKMETALIFVGGTFCLAGLLLNEYILGALLAPDGVFQSSAIRAVIWLIDLILIIWGVTTIVFRKRPFVTNFNLALTTLVLITPLVGELFIRSAINLHVDFFRNPRLYAGWLDDDDHWKLHYLWVESSPETGRDFIVDPLLGWAPRQSPDNPLGTLAEAPYAPNFTKKAILFYGDSFVYGVLPVPVSQRIPQQLAALLPEYQVYNYGVIGYGLDQIFLRFRESHVGFQQPFIIIGLLTLDLDRSILTVYDAPKPYFAVKEEKLILKGVPVPQDTAAWYRQNPPSINSYLAALVTRQYRVISGGLNQLELPYKQAEKKQVNTKIIEAIVAEAQSRRLPLLFVIFYSPFEFEGEGWRELFLKNLLTRLEVPYLDTKEVLQREGAEQSLNILQFYEGGHLNERGNRVVAEAIADYFNMIRSGAE